MKKLYLILGILTLIGCDIGFAQDTLKYSGKIDTFTVSPCVTSITIDVRGAQGGGTKGGLGARMVGTFTVTSGQQLYILVGGQGKTGSDGDGGGGGTFVVNTSDSAWIVAGGGGGEGSGGVGGRPGDTNLSGTNGTVARSGGTGGTNGGGGGGSTDNGSCSSGGGGGGFCGNGGEASNGGTPGTGGSGCSNGGNGSGTLCASGGGKSFLNGGNGGVGCSTGGCTKVKGGYGGGGGTAGGGGGGGGGYSGGGGAGWQNGSSGGGGGGSYNNGTNRQNTTGFQKGNGLAIITWSPAQVIATIIDSNAVSCNGDSDGSAVVLATGGAPYTYSWDPAGGSNDTATGLSVGTYTVTVTDAGGCTATTTVTITEPVGLTVAINSVNELCAGGNTGSATAVVGGGTVPYTYLWTNGQMTASITGLSAGGYTVTVTDGNGCTASASVTITAPPQLMVSVSSQVNVLCNGNNTGSITLNVTGGTGVYTYSWTNGQTIENITGLSAGGYTVTVTDANGCTAVASATITEPPVLVAVIGSQTNVLCNGGKGSATVVAGGGTPNYSYSWTDGESAATATNLIAGSYTVTVTDADGCSVTAGVTITQPSALTAVMSFTAASCNNSNGSATVLAGGGTGVYGYLWTPGNVTGATDAGIPAGSYTVVVTDGNGCTITATVSVTQPNAVNAGITSITDVSCFGGSNGSATVTASVGPGPYRYMWSNLQTTATVTGLSAGGYTVTVEDTNGCTVEATVVITQPAVLTANITGSTNVLCQGGNNGSATVLAGGGTSPYGYLWTNGVSTATATGLTAGGYTVTVTDANGCTASASVDITEPLALAVSIGGVIEVRCNGQNDGSAIATPVGGTVPYKYSWSNGATGSNVTGLVAGVYIVTVTDGNGCTADANVSVTQPAVLATGVIPGSVSCYGGNNGSISSVTSGGTVPYTYEWSNGATTSNISGLIAGSYTVTVEDGNGCTAVGSTVIVEPAQLVVTSSGTQYICSGAPVTLVSNVSGGTPKYVYSWSNGGGTNADANVAPAFTTIYTVTVEDGNGCIGTSASEVIAGTPLVVSVAGKASVCPGGTVTLTASGSGGDGKYSYLWLPGNEVSRSITINPTQNTTVTVELTDACGSAMASEAVGVSVNPLPKVSFSSDVVSGCVPLCIQFRDLTTIGSGGVGQWNWSFGDGDSSRIKSPIYCYKDTGIFSVGLTVVSDSGCSSTLKVSNDIEVYAGPKAGFRYSPNPVDVESPEVYFTDESRGEYPVREWYWTFGQGDSVSEAENPEHYYPDTGTFCVRLIVEDIHGCVDSVRECLVIDPQYSFFIPDAFTPNGDGINDEFMPKGRYISSYEMYVFDRWGMQLFHSTDMSKGWDGTRGGGTVCQEDTYVYLIKVTDSQGNVHNYTGKISLIK